MLLHILLQVTQNKCICFCLKLNSGHHIGAKECQEIHWLTTTERVQHWVATNIFKYWKGTSPFYVNKLFVPSRNIYKTRLHNFCPVPCDSMETGLGSSDQEVSASAGKNTRVILVPYCAWKCVPTAISSDVDISEVLGCHLL